jgi:hypothetical protein
MAVLTYYWLESHIWSLYFIRPFAFSSLKILSVKGHSMLMPSRVNTGCLAHYLLVNLFADTLDCIFEDSTLTFGILDLVRISLHNMMPFIRSKYMSDFFNKAIGIRHPYFKI